MCYWILRRVCLDAHDPGRDALLIRTVCWCLAWQPDNTSVLKLPEQYIVQLSGSCFYADVDVIRARAVEPRLA